MTKLAMLLCLLSSHALAQAVVPSAPPRPPAVRTPGVEPHFPTPGATPAGAGLTTIGPPGREVTAPRSPNARVLPATSEPGVWSADEPQGAIKNPPKHTLVGPGHPDSVRRHELPHLDGINVRSFNLSSKCAMSLDQLMDRMPPALKRAYEEGHAASGNTQAQCVVARGYLACVEVVMKNGGHKWADRFDPLPLDRGDFDRKKAFAHAARNVKEKCPESSRTAAADRVVQYLRDALEREQGG